MKREDVFYQHNDQWVTDTRLIANLLDRRHEQILKATRKVFSYELKGFNEEDFEKAYWVNSRNVKVLYYIMSAEQFVWVAGHIRNVGEKKSLIKKIKVIGIEQSSEDRDRKINDEILERRKVYKEREEKYGIMGNYGHKLKSLDLYNWLLMWLEDNDPVFDEQFLIIIKEIRKENPNISMENLIYKSYAGLIGFHLAFGHRVGNMQMDMSEDEILDIIDEKISEFKDLGKDDPFYTGGKDEPYIEDIGGRKHYFGRRAKEEAIKDLTTRYLNIISTFENNLN